MKDIDNEGKRKLVKALCEGKITADMYELTTGESIVQTLKEWYSVARENDRNNIIVREQKGLISHEECLFILGEGPEPEDPYFADEKPGRDHGKRKTIFLKSLNNQTEREKLHREKAKRMVVPRGAWLKKVIDVVGRHENGEISRGELEKELWNTYPRILFYLHDIRKFTSRHDIAVIAKCLCLSLEECQTIFEEEAGE